MKHVTMLIYVTIFSAENYTMLLKEIKEDLNKRGDILCSMKGKHTQWRCQFFLNWYTGLTQFISKSQQFFVDIDKIILKLI